MSLRRTILALLMVLMGLHAAPAQAAAAYQGYVMGYFKESPNQSGDSYALHLAVSSDGLNWMPLNQNNPVATPTAGMQGLRDPYILRKQDGTFVVLATDLKGRVFNLNNQYIHVWDSANLTGFSNYRRVRLHGMNTHSWAPEAFWVPSRNQYAVIYSAHNGTRDVFMVNYTTDFINMGTPQVFFDPGFNVLDGDVLVDGGTFYLAYKNLADGNLYVARSTTGAPNSFTTLTGGLRQGNGIEAPILVKSNTSGTFWLWGDSYSPANAVFYAWQSGNTTNWSAIGQRAFTPPINAKHATISPITAAEQSALVGRWGAPQWNRLKSANFPDRYVRHANNIARIDPFPMDPTADQQWRLVPGLADAAGVSFESVNFPGRYLRHWDYALRLDPNDNTSAFRADATFYRTAGLADGAWASFRSYNFPDRYIRHSGYLLRIDQLSSASAPTARQDATFQVTY
ncbi:Alpha-L-arabinofuranosidase B (ABFB) domain-containing protein [Nonomuraea solani]|uniref:Alpha-L-arabinofuranosidase B (ABFB) domain-containing protein n=1 Tax=Nonomuraea solani TaxID=1144553 RepID=A0A1H5W2I3_9ACTN|nr:glycoside hydrolase family 43 protein [Nonomuraea solani]SEF93660.1 Alpha-L-arabinofuranosidase B (ABFB) domain-containing protein [Nonomuraea solani]